MSADSPFVTLLACFALVAPLAPAASTNIATRYNYLPPSWADSVVFLHRFENGLTQPEVNTLGAQIRGEATPTAGGPGALSAAATRAKSAPRTGIPAAPSGLTGRGYRAAKQSDGKTSLQIDCPGLAVNRAITVMLWFRLDAPMQPETSFQLIKLGGPHGHISSFVRGKGDWAGLREPTYISQVWDFPGVVNHNNTWGGPVAFRAGEWHHVAITVSAASLIAIYWDGVQRETIALRGRLFRADDVSWAQLDPNWLYHPMTIDDVVVVRQALDRDQIAAYVRAVHALRRVRFPTGIVRAAPPVASHGGRASREPQLGGGRASREPQLGGGRASREPLRNEGPSASRPELAEGARPPMKAP